MYALILLMLGISGLFQGSAEDLYWASQDRSCLGGKRFHYRVTCEVPIDWADEEENGDGGIPPVLRMSGTVEWEIGLPSPGRAWIPYRYTRRMQNVDEPHLDETEVVVYWQAFDGKETRSFERALFEHLTIAPAFYEGIVRAGAHADFSSDPFVQSVTGGTAFFARLLGRRESYPPPDDVEFEKVDLPGVGEALHWFSPQDPAYSRYYNPAPPYFEVGSPSSDFQIVAFQEYQGVEFPKSGVFGGALGKQTFELISIGESDTPKDEWFPKWEEGTAVRSLITETVEEHPFSAEHFQLILQRLRENRGDDLRKTNAWKYILTAANIALIAALIWLWRRRKISRRSYRN